MRSVADDRYPPVSRERPVVEVDVADQAAANDDLASEIRDGIVYVTFNRPAVRNALTFAMYDRLAEIVRAVDGDRSIRAMLITGAGEEAFASGTDISQFREFKTREDVLGYQARVDGTLAALEQCRVPVVAAIAGSCTGAGASIAACCDIRIAGRTARFGFPSARTLGNTLSFASFQRLLALIGPAHTKELLFTAALITATEAKAIGFVAEVLRDHNSLMMRAEELVQRIASHAPLTLETAKQAIRRLRPRPTSDDDGSDLVLRCYLSDDFREGVEAFLDKRPPKWTGK
jgi:enoyl-CoA hydratase/carnithine racemase